MSWAKVDDQFFSHRKVIGLSKDAKLLFLASLTHSAANLTDGAITPADLRIISAIVDVNPKRAGELSTAGLWEVDGDGFQIHNYGDYNPSAEEVKRERDANAKRQKAWRDKRRSDSDGNSVSNAFNDSVSNAVTNTASNGCPVPVPLVTNVTSSSNAGETESEAAAAADFSGGVEDLSDQALLERARRDYPPDDFPDFWEGIDRRLAKAKRNPPAYVRRCILEQYQRNPPGQSPPKPAKPAGSQWSPPPPESWYRAKNGAGPAAFPVPTVAGEESEGAEP